MSPSCCLIAETPPQAVMNFSIEHLRSDGRRQVTLHEQVTGLSLGCGLAWEEREGNKRLQWRCVKLREMNCEGDSGRKDCRLKSEGNGGATGGV